MREKHQPCGKPGCLNCIPSTSSVLSTPEPIFYIGEPLRQTQNLRTAKELIQSMTEQDYKIIALQATVAQQAQMIEHLRGGLGSEPQLVSYAEDMSTCTLTTGDGTGYFYDRVDPDHPTTGYTAVDMANAARDGFRDGAASVVVELPFLFPYYRQEVVAAIIAAGGSVKDE